MSEIAETLLYWKNEAESSEAKTDPSYREHCEGIALTQARWLIAGTQGNSIIW